jgi:fluoroacetyl-CoA thioesterase
VEWTTRQFAIDMCESGEEGIGTYLEIHHDAPARVGEEICIRGVVESLNGNKLICTFEVRAGERLVAHGRTAQKILKKELLQSILSQ